MSKTSTSYSGTGEWTHALQMITSFKDIAAAMTRCVAIIEDYTRLTPSNLALDSGSLNTFNIGQADVKGGKKAADDKKKKKKEKKPRDPNAPRRPPSAYLLFQNEQREGIKQTHPNMAYKDILMHVAEKWKNLTPEQKKASLLPLYVLGFAVTSAAKSK